MDIFDWYFKQIVTQSQMDWAFDSVQDSIHGASLDNEFVGIVTGMDAQQHAAIPDLTVDITGPGVAYDPEGQRCHVPDLLTVVDCSQDEFGTSTDPPTVAFERYVSIFVRFNRDLTEPALDGNNVVIYTKQLESFEFFVRQGAEAAAGLAIPAPLMADAVLICDILVTHGFTAILNADFDLTRREDWVRFVGATIGTHVYGTAREAVDGLLTTINALGSAFPFLFTSTWFGSAAVAGSAPPPTTIQECLDAIVYDLAKSGSGSPPYGAALVGSEDWTSAGSYVAWAAKSVQGAMEAIGAAVDGHIGGAAPYHPATAITFAAYSWLSAASVQLALQEIVDDLAATGTGTSGVTRIGAQAIAGSPESITAGALNVLLTAIYGHLNDRPERTMTEYISGDWWFSNVINMTGDYQNMKSRFGGGIPPDATQADICGRKTWGTRKTWSQMFDPANSHTCAAAVTDICCAYYGKDSYVLAMVPSTATVEIVNTRDITDTDVADISVTGTPTPTAICSNGQTIFVMFDNDTVYAWTFSPTPGGGAWTSKFGPISLPTNASGTYDRIAVVTDLYLMTANSGLDAVTGGCFTRMNVNDGSAVVSGIGSMTSSATNYPRGGIASCGTTFYATTLDVSGNAELVEIDPATMGDPGYFVGGNPAGGSTTNDWKDIVCDGSFIWIAESKIAPGYIHVYPVEQNVTAYTAIEFTLPTSYFARHLVFDGFNIWFTRHTTALGTPNGIDLQSVPACSKTGVGGKTSTGMVARLTQPWNDITSPQPGKMTFDGDAVWAIQDIAEYPLVICRLPHAPDRC